MSGPARPRDDTGMKTRLDSLDVVRGVALAGIAFANAPSLWQLSLNYRDNLPLNLLNLLVTERFFPVFSLLFGIGFGMMWLGGATRLTLLRRILGLAVFAVPHFFLHPGEALTPYAVTALVVLLPATYLPERHRALIAAGAGGALTLAGLVLGGGLATVPGLFLLGFGLGLWRVPELLDDNLRLPALALLGLLPASVALGVWAWGERELGAFAPSTPWAGIVMAATWVMLVLALMATPLRRALTLVFAPLGRMALSNYLGATVILLLLAPAAGTYPLAFATVLAMLSAQWLFSRLWLTHVGQGPCERLWRLITWGRMKA